MPDYGVKASSAGKQINAFTTGLRRVVAEDAVRRQVMLALGKEAVRLIRVRTRLGRTARRTLVRNELGEIKNRVIRLKPHAQSYRDYRYDYQDFLSPMTRWNRSNLTFGGQLLASIGVRRVSDREVIIGANNETHVDPVTGKLERITNAELSEYVTEQGRPFLELSGLDDKKLVRFYRRRFSDLLKRFGRIRK